MVKRKNRMNLLDANEMRMINGIGRCMASDFRAKHIICSRVLVYESERISECKSFELAVCLMVSNSTILSRKELAGSLLIIPVFKTSPPTNRNNTYYTDGNVLLAYIHQNPYFLL